MDPKQARLQSLREFLVQAGKRLSKKSTQAIEDAIAKLQELIGSEDAEEDVVEQAFVLPQAILCQALVAGISVSDTYDMLILKVSRALHRDDSLPGKSWSRWSIYTHPQWVAFSSWNDEDESYVSYIADYVIAGDAVTFSNVRKCSIETIIRVIEESTTVADNGVEMQATAPRGFVIEQGEGLPSVLIQSADITNVHIQEETDGSWTFGGTATVGDVRNCYNQVYPATLWAGRGLTQAQDMIGRNALVGADGHKEDAQGHPRLPNAGELVCLHQSVEMVGNQMKFEAKGIDTQAGNDVKAALKAGVALEMSTVCLGEVKKQKWTDGKSAYVVQDNDKFELLCIDVVLRGASPGSTIDHARLQAAKMGPIEEDETMNLEEIKKLIAQALADNDESAVKLLQAELDKMKASLEQAQKTSALTDEQTELLKQAQTIIDERKAEQIAQARDAKAEAFVETLTQKQGDADPELNPQFKTMAVGLFKQHALTADDVEGAKGIVMSALKPFIDEHAKMQSAAKGMYVPEFEREGEKKIHVNSVPEAIEDLVQTAIKQNKITDNGVDDPSNMARNARLMLQTIAVEKRECAVAYMMQRNGDIRGLDDADRFLRQNYRSLVQDIPAGAMTTTDVAAAIPFVMPIVMELLPQLVAARYCSFQPMSKSLGTIAYWKIKDEDDANLIDKTAFTGSYANDPGEKQTMKKIKGNLTTENISPTAKKLGYDLSVEVIRRLGTDWGMDATGIMIAECAAEIAREWNYNHLANMVQGATAGNRTYNYGAPTDASFDGKQWQEEIMTYLTFSEADIGELVGANTVAILGSRASIARFVIPARRCGLLNGTGEGGGNIARGVNIVGSTLNGEDLVSVDWWDDVVADDQVLLIARGNEWYRTGYVVAPYLGLYISPQWTDPETLDVMQGTLSEVATKMVNGNYFATITIASGAGTPL